MKLTFNQIKALKPGTKRVEITVAPGLMIRVSPTGKKTWYLNKSINGKRVVKNLGDFPEMTPAMAELAVKAEKGDTAYKDTFAEIYSSWLKVKKTQILHWEDIDEKFKKYLLPFFGSYLWVQVTPRMMVDHLNEYLTKQGKLETLKRISGYLSQMDKFARNTGRAEYLKFDGLTQAFPRPKASHRKTIEPERLKELAPVVRDVCRRSPIAWITVQVAFYTLLRPAEYCAMEWKWIDREKKIITVPSETMKMKKEHVVPITPQLSKVLDYQYDPNGVYVLSSPWLSDKHVGTEALSKLFRKSRLTECLQPHGIRAIGRTWMAENGVEDAIAELCLAHSIGTSTMQAYDRSVRLQERRDAMEKWCKFVEECFS